MSELHDFEADLLHELITARKEGRQFVCSDKQNPAAGISSFNERFAKSLLGRGFVKLSASESSDCTYLAITDKGIAALAERLAAERLYSLERLEYSNDLQEVMGTLLEVIRDQAQRIAELELRA